LIKHKLTMTLLVVAAVVLSTLATFTVAGPVLAAPPDDPDVPATPWPVDDPRYRPSINDNVILKWNEELLQSIRANPGATGPVVAARSLGFLHTATYDAWEAYEPVAKSTRPNGIPEQPVSKDPLVNQANKSKAISYAAHRVLVDLFPSRTADFNLQMQELSLPSDGSSDGTTPATVGIQAAQAVIDFRHADGSNQTLNTKGTTDPSDDTVTYPYLCTTGCYTPVNTGDTVTDPWRWQPLRVPLGTGNQQSPLAPHWGNVKPFALTSALQYKVPGPPKTLDGSSYSTADIQTALNDTADLTDTEKVRAEYWADGPNTEFPPGHWALFAQILSRKRGHSLDTDTKLFFALGNALLDSSIAAWAQKYQYDFPRPITSIRAHPDFKDTTVRSWLGPYNGYGDVPGSQWRPYQAPNVVTPPFPEYVSGHSTFSAAANKVLIGFTGSDAFGASITVKAGTSLFEPANADHPVGTPATDVTLSWPTFTAAADDAGLSRRNGGIHFYSGDLHGRSLGRMVGSNAWSKTQSYLKGYSGY
jgi:hypothetical protein